MNIASAILLVVLSGDGYWFGGNTATAEFQWGLKRPREAATVSWRLVCGDASLAAGQIVLPATQRTAQLRLKLPEVRVPTALRLVYWSDRAGQSKPIAEGAAAGQVYPNNLLTSLAKILGERQLFIWDEAAGLPALLKPRGVPFAHVRGEADLQFVRPDVLIVAAEQLGKKVEGQAKLLNLAAAGTNVLILRQTQPATLAGYLVTRRAMPSKLAWRADHPLVSHLRSFPSPDWGSDGWAIRLPADEPALEICWWPGEAPSEQPAPIDCLIAAKTTGRGRIVFCQCPLGPWEADPRSQLFLVDALDYLVSPAVPTLPPSCRPAVAKPAPAPRVASIDLP
jgi:hypothetical protein